MKKTVLITGITGQDGAYLAEYLLHKNYDVHGLVRWDGIDTTCNIRDIVDKIIVHSGDITDPLRMTALIKTIQPDEIYNLAALSHVGESFDTPSMTINSITSGALNIFEAVRMLGLTDKTHIYQASSSEMFGNVAAPQTEQTPMIPCSPYGTAKLAAYHLARVYRETYGLFITNGILFNHESPKRGQDFVTQKIAHGVARIQHGMVKTPIMLGNLDASRDWGHAKDYVRGMYMMMQHDQPDDFVLATGHTYTVRDCVETAFKTVDISLDWLGQGVEEVGINNINGDIVVKVDKEFYRPNELNVLQGTSLKAQEILGWKPKYTFESLIAEMVESACDRYE